MTLTEIEYGSLASSAILNGNFNYLQEKITELSALHLRHLLILQLLLH